MPIRILITSVACKHPIIPVNAPKTPASAQLGINSSGGALGSSSYSYSINGSLFNPPIPSYNGFGPGDVIVVAKDINGCIGTTTQQIIEPDLIDPNIQPITSPYCIGVDNGEIESTPSGGTIAQGGSYSFMWMNNQVTPTISNLGVGQYSVIVTDDNGCVGYDTISLFPANTLSMTLSTTPVSCNGNNDGSATASLVGSGAGSTDTMMIITEYMIMDVV